MLILKNSILFFILVAFIILSGCSSTPARESPDLTIPSVQHIKVGGEGTIVLGEFTQPGIALKAFIAKIEELLQENRFLSAKYFVQKYPDLALDTLRTTTNAQVQFDSRSFIARVYDQMFLKDSSSKGWTLLLSDRKKNPHLYQEFDQKRSQLMEALHQGRFETMASFTLDSPQSTHGLMLQIDALYLRSIALLLSSRDQEAEVSLQKAIELTTDQDAYQQSNLLLLQSETQRRLGNPQKSADLWMQAVHLCSTAQEGSSPVEDPFLWERAYKLKPPKNNWPVTLNKDSDLSESVYMKGASDASLIWKNIGIWHLKRNEAQAALVAFRNGQMLEANSFVSEYLQFMQCKALLALKQNSAASASLIKLAQSANPLLASSALAMLGVIELQRDNLQRALGLLLRSVEHNNSNPWPDRADALADLGMIFLMMGSAEEGFQYLHEAQHHFKTDKQWPKLIQSFQNEMAYLKHIGEAEKSEVIQKQLMSLEMSYSSEIPN